MSLPSLPARYDHSRQLYPRRGEDKEREWKSPQVSRLDPLRRRAALSQCRGRGTQGGTIGQFLHPTWNCARPPMKRTKKISEGVRVAQVRQLFVAQHHDPAKRTATTVLIFYGWLERHRPGLLPKGKHDDPFQYLKSDLNGLYQA